MAGLRYSSPAGGAGVPGGGSVWDFMDEVFTGTGAAHRTGTHASRAWAAGQQEDSDSDDEYDDDDAEVGYRQTSTACTAAGVDRMS